MGIETIAAIGSLVGGVAALSSSLSKPKTPQMEQVAAAPEKQADKTPEASVYAKKNAATAGAEGPGSTLLSGSGGVADNMLTLGKNTLLGQ